MGGKKTCVNYLTKHCCCCRARPASPRLSARALSLGSSPLGLGREPRSMAPPRSTKTCPMRLYALILVNIFSACPGMAPLPPYRVWRLCQKGFVLEGFIGPLLGCSRQWRGRRGPRAQWFKQEAKAGKGKAFCCVCSRVTRQSTAQQRERSYFAPSRPAALQARSWRAAYSLEALKKASSSVDAIGARRDDGEE